MFWACTHNHTGVIQKLITRYEPSASTVEIPARILHNIITDYRGRLTGVSATIKVLTLNLVIRKCHVKAFELLLELGAFVNTRDSRVLLYQSRSLVRRLCRPPRRNLFILLFDAMARSQVNLTKPQLNRILILLITSDAPLDLIATVLDLETAITPTSAIAWCALYQRLFYVTQLLCSSCYSKGVLTSTESIVVPLSRYRCIFPYSRLCMCSLSPVWRG